MHSGAAASNIVLVGGGLAGGLLAAYLGRAGFQVDLYERRPDPEAGQFVGGRSINLAVSVRGIHALERIGLAEPVLRNAIPMRGRMIHDPRGGLHFQPYDKDPRRCIYSIGRGALNSATLAAARGFPNVRVHFNQRCVEADLDRPVARLHDETTGQTREAAGRVLIGVDGAFSVVRRAMQRLDRFDYSQSFLEHGYKELTIPPQPDDRHRLEPHALHIWPRRSFMMIALPNPDGSFTCTLFAPSEGPAGFAALRDDAQVLRFFRLHFPDAVEIMPTLTADFRHNPTGSMVTVRCRPWRHQDRVVLLGDAAHAVVPFYGQGMNAAFEDCVVFDECLAPCKDPANVPWTDVFAEYERRRKPHTDALAELALGNFIEMRDRTASRAFRAYKAYERTMQRLLPRWYTPLYTLVTFTRAPYADAVARARRQNRTVCAVLIALGVSLLLLMTFVRSCAA
jgi:kynurenine 3-monooxygenase